MNDPAYHDRRQPADAAMFWVVMPVYNESGCVEQVVEQWLDCLRTEAGRFVMCVVNDGSTDESLEVLRRLESRHGEIRILDKPNTGHGRSCLAGYRLALSNGAGHVFQIDSDGQCDPRFFTGFWALRNSYPAVYGNRVRREDGAVRRLVSRLLAVAVYAATGVYAKDPNVPYRLIASDCLAAALDRVPPDTDLANVYLATVQQKAGEIHWIDIIFRERSSGRSSATAPRMIRKGWELLKQLTHNRSSL